MTYKMTRNVENHGIATHDVIGRFDIPIIGGMTSYEEVEFVGFNEAMTCKDKSGIGVHFYLDDYQFTRVWKNPRAYLHLLKEFKYVLSPDFSMFTDYPAALSLYNHYRKHWLGAYWQENGINVIPSINWVYKDSYEWCFDGEPRNSIVSVSSIGVCNSVDMIRMFNYGFEEMMERLHPTQVLFFGKNILEMEYDDILMCKTSQAKRLGRLRKV